MLASKVELLVLPNSGSFMLLVGSIALLIMRSCLRRALVVLTALRYRCVRRLLAFDLAPARSLLQNRQKFLASTNMTNRWRVDLSSGFPFEIQNAQAADTAATVMLAAIARSHDVSSSLIDDAIKSNQCSNNYRYIYS